MKFHFQEVLLVKLHTNVFLLNHLTLDLIIINNINSYL